MIYYVKGDNLYGKHATFTKPWFQVLTMFVGMSLCIILDGFNERQRRKKRAHHHHHHHHRSHSGRAREQTLNGTSTEQTPLLSSSSVVETNGESPHHHHHHHHHRRKQPNMLLLIQLPTMLDLLATACGTTGLLFTTVSVYQMLRGGQLVFVAMLSVIFLKRKLSILNYLGITFCTAGITLVGLANVYGEVEEHTKNQTLFGVLIILLGQLLQGAQSVVEEHFMKNLQMSSVKVVAWEGVFGVLHCICWALPLVYFLPGRDHGHIEDSLDSLYMISHSYGIIFIMALDMTMMLFYNLSGMIVTESLSAIHRVVIETLRTLCVWVIDIVLYYWVTDGYFGEAWTKYSYLQMVGFGLLVLGTLTYNSEQILSEYYTSRKAGLAEEIVGKSADVVAEVSTKDVREATLARKLGKMHEAAVDHVDEGGEVSEEELGSEESYSSDSKESEPAGSFYRQPFGSASHGSYLLASTPAASKDSPFFKHRDTQGRSIP